MIAVVIVVVLVALRLALLVGVVKQYQVGVMLFRLGWGLGPRRPELHRIVPVVNVLHRVWLRNMTMPDPVLHHHPRQRQRDVSTVAYFSPVPVRPHQRSREWLVTAGQPPPAALVHGRPAYGPNLATISVGATHNGYQPGATTSSAPSRHP